MSSDHSLFTGSSQQDLNRLLDIMEKGNPLAHLPDTHPARQVLKTAVFIHDLGVDKIAEAQLKTITDYESQTNIPKEIDKAILQYQAKYFAPEPDQSKPAQSHVAKHRPEGKRPHCDKGDCAVSPRL